jgi:hypothetical protein
MTTALKWFAAAFAVLFCVGLLRTCSDGARTAMALETIDNNMRVENDGARYFLTYQCSSHTLYKYDIDAQRFVYMSERARRIRQSLAARPHRDRILTADLGVEFIGGAAGVWSLADIVVLVKSGKGGAINRAAAGAAGALSGYSVGYYTGRMSFARCDSKSVHATLMSPGIWPKLALHQLYMAYVPISNVESDTKNVKPSHMQRLLKLADVLTASDPDEIVATSQHFATVDAVKRARSTSNTERR